MKILYTLGNFVHSGHQVLFYTINGKDESTEDYQKLADKTFAPSFEPKHGIFNPPPNIDPVDPPMPGDIIWTHTSGNQYIGSGIWQLEPNGPIDFNALRLIARSVYNKASELDQQYVSMPLLTNDLSIWNFVYPIIEGEFEDSVQAIVHIPDEKTMLALLDGIGGEINAFQANRPTIRFSQSTKE